MYPERIRRRGQQRPGRQDRFSFVHVDGERGSVSLQLAVIFPVVLTLLLLSVQAGLFFHARHVARAAANEGLRAARLYDHTAGDGQAAAAQLLRQSGGDLISDEQVTAARDTNTASVSVTGHAISLLPGISLNVSETSTGPVERFTPDLP
jgi:Flp pilus assembly protein TadG